MFPPNSRWILFLTLVCLTTVCRGQQREPDESRLRGVKSGNVQEARADWWGFHPDDATDSLQAAIDSGAEKLIVPNMSTPWIVRPLKLASDQEIVFESGVIIEAKRNEFHGRNDSLFSASNQHNITLRGDDVVLRMHKQDYDNKDLYKRAEWRHVISLHSCSHVTIDGLTLKSSGGDGVYIGANQSPPNYCEDITIKNCLIDDQYRQGISVISVVDLLVENCVIENTQGTAPQAGIDFEPNAKSQRLSNIVVRDCTIRNNVGGGVIVLAYMENRPEPISFLFQDCRVIQDRGKPIFAHFVNGGMPPRDRIDVTLQNFQVEQNGEHSVLNDFWKDVMQAQELNDRELEVLTQTPPIDPHDGTYQPLSASGSNSGNLDLPLLRGASHAMVYAEQGQTIQFDVQLHRDYGKGVAVTLESPAGEQRPLANWRGTDRHSLEFTASESGNYIIAADPGKGWHSYFSKQTPMAITAIDQPIHFFGTKPGRIYFYVPANTPEFYATVMGEGGERIQATLFDPDDRVYASQSNICLPYHFVVDRDPNAKGEVWSLKLERSPGHAVEDYYLNLVGVPPIVSGNKDHIFKPVEPINTVEIRADYPGGNVRSARRN